MNIVDELNKFGSVEHIKSGDEKPLKDFSFRYIGLYFTATWCSYCVQIANKISPLISTVNSKGNFFRLLTLRLD